MTSPGYSTYEELEALTAPFWARLTAQGIERRRLALEAELEIARWEGRGPSGLYVKGATTLDVLKRALSYDL